MGIKLKVNSDYDEPCSHCKSREQIVIGATPSEPFDGTSWIDLQCKKCGNIDYHSTEGYVELES